MAAPSTPVGYKCDFVDLVPEDYFCKQCSHVAREPQIASCCIEVFCKVCIEAVIQDKKPCPSCQETDISFIPHKKYQPKILALKVHCSLKDRGCEWTGQLQHLDAHLDLTTGDCVYVDVDCPSKCNQKVQKHDVDTHLVNHCPNRDYTCPHCSFKATFREVSEHFEVCRYYPLVCPNRCGASFERDVLEDHIQMCGLQKLQCEFSYAGCGAEFIRNHQKEHMEQNTQKHLALVAAATLRISQEQRQAFEQKLQEQQREFDQKLEDKDSEIKAMVNNEASQLVNEQRQQSDAQIRDLQEKLQEQQQIAEKSLEEQKVFEKKLGEQQEDFHKQQRMLEEKLEEKDQQIKLLEDKHGQIIDRLRMQAAIAPYESTLITDYEKARRRNECCIGPPMYMYPGGYGFRIWVYPNGVSFSKGAYISVGAGAVSGDHDDKLKFPFKFAVTLTLLNQHRNQNHYTREVECDVLEPPSKITSIYKASINEFISHADLEWNERKQTQYLKNNCLKFRIIGGYVVA